MPCLIQVTESIAGSVVPLANVFFLVSFCSFCLSDFSVCLFTSSNQISLICLFLFVYQISLFDCLPACAFGDKRVSVVVV